MAGRLTVRCTSHPSEVTGEVILDEEFDASRWTGRQIADLAIARVRQVSPGREYDARVIERDTSWGADASAVEVILDVSSRIADFGGDSGASSTDSRGAQGSNGRAPAE
jgi:hypothetical protein